MAGQLDERRPSPSTGSLLRRWVTPVAVLALALVTGVAALREPAPTIFEGSGPRSRYQRKANFRR